METVSLVLEDVVVSDLNSMVTAMRNLAYHHRMKAKTKESKHHESNAIQLDRFIDMIESAKVINS